MSQLKVLAVLAAVAMSGTANAALLVQTSDFGFFNDDLGTILNGTNGGETGPFPIGNDGAFSFPTAPDLSAASSILGNWLSNPASLNSHWNAAPAAIPATWAEHTEMAVIYRFTSLGGLANVVASLGVDNGIFAWIDGVYLGGARASGTVFPGEHTFASANLSAGTHYLQLLLEDHGGAQGYSVQLTGDVTAVPEPATLALLGLGLAALGFQRRRKV